MELKIYLFDKGYWKGANFQALDEKGIRFVTQVKWYANITRTLDAQLAADPMRGRQVVELMANANGQDVPGFKGLLRVIAIDDKNVTEFHAKFTQALRQFHAQIDQMMVYF